ncbi:MAG: class I SAM-dependent methyltransferase [Novosphingobium sp.]|nr:class I SAM-dependent methyltransferase [Novosphingobium sp.]MCP5404125.1 class I SAM-dependent methyltransferase [Novosphingobium sp.]
MAERPSARFWDRISEKYAGQPVADEAAYQEKLRITREYLRPEMEVLEIGCGTGSTAIAHAPYVRHIRAVDFSANMVEIARGKARAGNIANVSFEQAAVDTLDVEDGSVDAVLALSVLHLLDDRQAAIGKAYRWLRPGGIFVSSTACLSDSMAFLRFILPIVRFFGRAPMVKFFSSAELRQDIENAGFAIEREWMPGPGKALFMVARKPVATAQL